MSLSPVDSGSDDKYQKEIWEQLLRDIGLTKRDYVKLHRLADRIGTSDREIVRLSVKFLLRLADREPATLIVRRDGYPDETLHAPL